ncbi:MAG TPA: hypothetical protein VG963_16895 [Polyangiaceae bacterium]|nr:hypothetical protein [Polyangiaceae bacterium]
MRRRTLKKETKRWGRWALAGLALLVSAVNCGGDDDTSPAATGGTGGAERSGSAGTGKGGSSGTNGGGSAGASASGARGGEGGSEAGAGGMSGGGGNENFGCRSTTCAPQTVRGSCPDAEPEYGSACSELGSTCSYCGDARSACSGSEEAYMLQCCLFGWGFNCYDDCVEARSSGNTSAEGGQAGAGEPSSAPGGLGGAANTCAPLLTSCCDTDGDCPRNFECAPGAGFGYSGTCRGRLADTHSCWKDADCPPHYVCSGALFCGCGESCNDEFTGVCAHE